MEARERERERGGTGARFEAGGRMINASEPADMQQMRDAFASFLPSFVSKVEACTRVKGSADGHGITALPASKSISFPPLSLDPIDRSNPSNVFFRTRILIVHRSKICCSFGRGGNDKSLARVSNFVESILSPFFLFVFSFKDK